MERKLLNTKNVVLMGMFGALAAVLMLFEVPLPFLAPSFYGLDFAEVPMLVGTFALGPVAGIVMQIVKILIKLILKPTSTGFVGEFANVVMSCALILPAGFIYRFKKSKNGALAGMASGHLPALLLRLHKALLSLHHSLLQTSFQNGMSFFFLFSASCLQQIPPEAP